jgi:hypothetical protein
MRITPVAMACLLGATTAATADDILGSGAIIGQEFTCTFVNAANPSVEVNNPQIRDENSSINLDKNTCDDTETLARGNTCFIKAEVRSPRLASCRAVIGPSKHNVRGTLTAVIAADPPDDPAFATTTDLR